MRITLLILIIMIFVKSGYCASTGTVISKEVVTDWKVLISASTSTVLNTLIKEDEYKDLEDKYYNYLASKEIEKERGNGSHIYKSQRNVKKTEIKSRIVTERITP